MLVVAIVLLVIVLLESYLETGRAAVWGPEWAKKRRAAKFLVAADKLEELQASYVRLIKKSVKFGPDGPDIMTKLIEKKARQLRPDVVSSISDLFTEAGSMEAPTSPDKTASEKTPDLTISKEGDYFSRLFGCLDTPTKKRLVIKDTTGSELRVGKQLL